MTASEQKEFYIEYDNFREILKNEKNITPEQLKEAVSQGIKDYIDNLLSDHSEGWKDSITDQNKLDINEKEFKLRKLFEIIEKCTGVKKRKERNSTAGTTSRYSELIKNWGKQVGCLKLCYATYYWLHLQTNQKHYAKSIDEKLFGEGVTFEQHFQKAVPGKEYKDGELKTLKEKNPKSTHKGATTNTASSYHPPLERFTVPEGLGENEHLSALNQTTIPYMGQVKELQALEGFANDQRIACVWAICGSSGAGKTRLVYHWMLTSEATGNWDQIVLSKKRKKHTDPADNREESAYWENWTPKRSTVIVIDYIHAFKSVAEAIIERFKQLQEQRCQHRVRLLLIDHVFPKDLTKFSNIQTSDSLNFKNMGGPDFDIFKKIFFKDSPLDLQLEDADQDALIRKLMKHRATTPQKDGTKAEITDELIEEAILNLKKMSGAWHPLFALFIGDALRDNQYENSWKRHHLIKYYFSGKGCLTWLCQEGRTQRFDIEGAWASVWICIATARCGISPSLLAQYLPKDISQDNVFEKGYLMGTSLEEDDDVIFFGTDILGESFFLTFLDALHHSADLYRMVGDFFSTCWMLARRKRKKGMRLNLSVLSNASSVIYVMMIRMMTMSKAIGRL